MLDTSALVASDGQPVLVPARGPTPRAAAAAASGFGSKRLTCSTPPASTRTPRPSGRPARLRVSEAEDSAGDNRQIPARHRRSGDSVWSFRSGYDSAVRRMTGAGVGFVICLLCAQCGGDTPTGPTETRAPTTPPPAVPVPAPPPPPSQPQVFVGAGDIALCGSTGAASTARLLDGIGGTVFTLGDNTYPSGSAQEYRDCYDPTWGRHKSRTRPVPGNHEYETPGATPYFDYFGFNAGPSGLGYYSFDLGEWHAIALNSNVPVGSNSTQGAWLRADLASSGARCTVAYWHHPLFTSGPNGDQTYTRDFWRVLYDSGVDLVLNGHDHVYERFAPQDPNGRADSVRGIRQFTVGTGGAPSYAFATIRANSEVRLASVFGVLKLTLQTDSYQWDFVTTSGASDAGSGSCH
jgi:hypothetical protein